MTHRAWSKWDCRNNVKFKYVHMKSEMKLSIPICRKISQNFIWINKQCYDHRGKCNRTLRKLSKSFVMKRQQFGNPYFQKCHLMGGDAVLVKYLWGKKWIDSSLCRFKNGDIVSISFLP